MRDYLEQRMAEIHENKEPAPWQLRPLFLSERRNRLSQRQIQRVFKEIGEEAGIKKRVSPHIFRHSVLTHLSKDVKAVVLQRIADHRDLKTTGRYATQQMVDVKEALAEANSERSEREKPRPPSTPSK